MLGFIFGWEHKIRGLRKKWDRMRERALKKHDPIKSDILSKLDMVENSIRTLEEQKLNRVVRARMVKETEIGLAEIEALLKSSKNEFDEYRSVKPEKD